jgi:hypothetical protein
MMLSGRHAPSNSTGQKRMIRARSLGLNEFQRAIGVVEILCSRLTVKMLRSSLGAAANMADTPYIRTAYVRL